MEPKMEPKIDQNPSLSPPGAQDEPKVPPRPLPDLQNEPSGLKNEPRDLKNEAPGFQKFLKIPYRRPIFEDSWKGISQGLAAEAYAFRSAAARSCLRANAGVLGHWGPVPLHI